MLMNPSFPIRLLLAQFEEELLAFKNIVFNLPPTPSGELLYGLLDRSVFLLYRCGEFLRFVTEEEKDKELQNEILSAVFDALYTVKNFYDRVEKRNPLFLDRITVFFEPLEDKLNQLVKTLRNALNAEENTIDLEEIAYIIDELSQTVEILIKGFKKMDGQIL
jgi:hypothetical protein